MREFCTPWPLATSDMRDDLVRGIHGSGNKASPGSAFAGVR